MNKLNKSDVAAALATRIGDKHVAEAAVDGFIDIIERAIAKGDKVALSGFGTFGVEEKVAARQPGQRGRARKITSLKFTTGTELAAIAAGDKKVGRLGKVNPVIKNGMVDLASITNTPVVAETRTPLSEASKAAVKHAVAKAAPNGTSAAEIRAWATSNGYNVPQRGRIPADVQDAFHAATTGGESVEDSPLPTTETPKRRGGRPKGSKNKKTTRTATTTKATQAADFDSPATIRGWAMANGYSVPQRGRIPVEIQNAFRAAHEDTSGQTITAEADNPMASTGPVPGAPRRGRGRGRQSKSTKGTPVAVEQQPAEKVAAKTNTPAPVATNDSAAIREWGIANGYQVPRRGPLGNQLKADYAAAISGTQPTLAAAPEATPAPVEFQAPEVNTKTPAKARGRRKKVSHAEAVPDMKTVREWAKGRGMEVPQRGRLPKTLLDEYMQLSA